MRAVLVTPRLQLALVEIAKLRDSPLPRRPGRRLVVGDKQLRVRDWLEL
jgi:hypothetical protein